MRAAVMRSNRLVVAEIPLPEPGPGEVLVKTLACGICGSDLHALKHGEAFVEASRRAGSIFTMDLVRDVVMGHEFCAEIVAHGPDTRKTLAVGARVCSRPGLVRSDGVRAVGYSNDTPGGYAEYMRLTEALLLPVPNGLPTEQAALTEPMAVGVHAVNKARLERDDVPLVIGCGPVGLADGGAARSGRGRCRCCFRRRRDSPAHGADMVVDRARDAVAELARGGGLAGREPRAQAPAPAPGQRAPPAVPSASACPACSTRSWRRRGARIIVVGVCMERDTIFPMLGISKELALQFVLGYTPDEFAATLDQVAEGAIPTAPLITGKVGVEGVAQAFEDLASPERHAKILVEPWRS
jgi:threonine dehydrogenase-like Zn-dependent dehydrogenase